MRTGLEIAAWWLAGMIVWASTLATAAAAELVLAGIGSGVTAVLAVLGRRAIGMHGRPRRAWIAWTALVPLAALLDCLRLARWLVGSRPDPALPEGLTVRELPAGDSPAAVGWRQGALLSVSATPGTLAVDCDPDTGRVLLHPLVNGWPDLEHRVSR